MCGCDVCGLDEKQALSETEKGGGGVICLARGANRNPRPRCCPGAAPRQSEPSLGRCASASCSPGARPPRAPPAAPARAPPHARPRGSGRGPPEAAEREPARSPPWTPWRRREGPEAAASVASLQVRSLSRLTGRRRGSDFSRHSALRSR